MDIKMLEKYINICTRFKFYLSRNVFKRICAEIFVGLSAINMFQ